MQLDQIIGNGLLKYLYVITVQQDLAALPLICPAAKDEATNGLLLDAIFLADQTPIFFQAPLDQFVEEQNLLCQQRIIKLEPSCVGSGDFFGHHFCSVFQKIIFHFAKHTILAKTLPKNIQYNN